MPGAFDRGGLERQLVIDVAPGNGLNMAVREIDLFLPDRASNRAGCFEQIGSREWLDFILNITRV